MTKEIENLSILDTNSRPHLNESKLDLYAKVTHASTR